MMLVRLLLLVVARPCACPSSTPDVVSRASFQFAVDLANVTANASKGLVGAALEDINFSLYPGFYSQLVFGESFEESHIQGMALPKGGAST